MKVVSFNINSIRARPHQMRKLVEKHQPELIGLQETKVQDSEFPLEELKYLGYDMLIHGQKGHYGVALFHRLPLVEHDFGLPWDEPEAQRRMIRAVFELPDKRRLRVLNGYFPQGESRHHEIKFPYKRKFYQDLSRFLQEQCDPAEPIIVMGDMNISPSDLDIGIGEDNRKRWLSTGKCSFLPEEREWYNKLMGWGLIDAFRLHYSDASIEFSWFDYRSKAFEREPRRGLRIDHILLSSPLINHCSDAGIDLEIRSMEKPSDHCPVWATFDL